VNDVATNTAWVTRLLGEAAIVEAEWIHPQQDEALWERDLADLPAARRWPPTLIWTTQRSPPSRQTC